MTALARPLDAGFSGAQPRGSRKETRLGLSAAAIFGIATALVLAVGLVLPTEHYITPQRGVGYWLGIIGGSMMLLLFLYSARKRVRWLTWLGAITGWFRFHVIFGVVGPLCILFHSNFRLGATNSNVALFSMLLVVGSGLVGRYIYARVHNKLYGHGLTLKALRAGADGVRAVSVSLLPELVSRLEKSEQRLLSTGPRLLVLGCPKPAVLWILATSARLRLHHYIGTALRAAARDSAVVARQRARLHKTACAYVDKRLVAARLVASVQGYERLFSLWHSVHVPLIFTLIVAGVVHVVAVHVY
jgi:hypothetical protein